MKEAGLSLRYKHSWEGAVRVVEQCTWQCGPSSDMPGQETGLRGRSYFASIPRLWRAALPVPFARGAKLDGHGVGDFALARGHLGSAPTTISQRTEPVHTRKRAPAAAPPHPRGGLSQLRPCSPFLRSLAGAGVEQIDQASRFCNGRPPNPTPGSARSGVLYTRNL
jgi:hypothetical protein